MNVFLVQNDRYMLTYIVKTCHTSGARHARGGILFCNLRPPLKQNTIFSSISLRYQTMSLWHYMWNEVTFCVRTELGDIFARVWCLPFINVDSCSDVRLWNKIILLFNGWLFREVLFLIKSDYSKRVSSLCECLKFVGGLKWRFESNRKVN